MAKTTEITLKELDLLTSQCKYEASTETEGDGSGNEWYDNIWKRADGSFFLVEMLNGKPIRERAKPDICYITEVKPVPVTTIRWEIID